MPNAFDSAKLSDVIQSATREIASSTETFVQSVGNDSDGTQTVTIMVNGKEIVLSRENYNLLKAQTDVIKSKMKADIKDLTKKSK